MSVSCRLNALFIIVCIYVLFNSSLIGNSIIASDESADSGANMKIDNHDTAQHYDSFDNADFMYYKGNSNVIKSIVSKRLQQYVARERDKILQRAIDAYPESIVRGFELIINDINQTKCLRRCDSRINVDEPIRDIQSFELILGWLGEDDDIDGVHFRLKGDADNVIFSPINVEKRKPSETISYKFFRDEIFIFFLDEFASEFGINTRAVAAGLEIEKKADMKQSRTDFLMAPTYHKADGSYHSLEVALHSSNGGVSNWLPLLVIDKNNQNIPFDDNHIIKIPSDSQPANESK